MAVKRMLALVSLCMGLQACGQEPVPPIIDPATGGRAELLPLPSLERHVSARAEAATSDSMWRVVSARGLGRRLSSRAGGRSRSSSRGAFLLIRLRVRNTSLENLRLGSLPVLALDEGTTESIPESADFLPAGEPAPTVEALAPNAERELAVIYELPRRRSPRAVHVPSLSLAGVGGEIDMEAHVR